MRQSAFVRVCARLAVALAPLALAASASAAGDVSLRVVTELDSLETDSGHLFYAGHLWVGKIVLVPGATQAIHRLEVYNADGTHLDAAIDLPHSIIQIAPGSENQVLITGKSSWPWKSHLTTVTLVQGRTPTVSTHTFAEDYLIEYLAVPVTPPARAGTPYYLSLPNDRGFLSYATRSTAPLSADVVLPGKSLIVGNALYAIERNNLTNFDVENVARVDLTTNAVTRTFPRSNRQHLTSIAHLPERNFLALSEAGADNVLLIDAKTNQLSFTIPVPQEPRGVAAYGSHCVAVASTEARLLTIWAVDHDEPELVTTWDLAPAGDVLRKPSEVAVDQTTGRVFVRSNYLCAGCGSTMSGVVAAEEEGGAAFERCR